MLIINVEYIKYKSIFLTISQSSFLDIGRTMKAIIIFLLLGTSHGAPGNDFPIKEFGAKFHQKFEDAELAKRENTTKCPCQDFVWCWCQDFDFEKEQERDSRLERYTFRLCLIFIMFKVGILCFAAFFVFGEKRKI